MLATQTTTYTLPITTQAEREEAYKFAEGVEAFYGWGGARVRMREKERVLIVEYDHIIQTRDTVFGGK